MLLFPFTKFFFLVDLSSFPSAEEDVVELCPVFNDDDSNVEEEEDEEGEAEEEEAEKGEGAEEAGIEFDERNEGL